MSNPPTWFGFGSSPKEKKSSDQDPAKWNGSSGSWIRHTNVLMRENLRLNFDSVRSGGTAKRRAGRCAESLLTHPQQSDREAEAGGRQEKFNQ